MKQFFIAIDQLVNTLVWSEADVDQGIKGGGRIDAVRRFLSGFGRADETLSARAWRLRDRRRWGKLQRALDRMFFWDRDSDGKRAHCLQSWLAEFDRHQLPEAYRNIRPS